MDIIVFGLGHEFLKNKEKLNCPNQEVNIIGLCDNNSELWGKPFDGTEVMEPEMLTALDFDAIVVFGQFYGEIHAQLIGLGISQEKIWPYSRLRSYLYDDLDVYSDIRLGALSPVMRCAIVISHQLIYDGGSLTAFYWGLALQKMGYRVTLMAPKVDSRVCQEIENQGITCICNPRVPYINETDINYISGFDKVCVNVFDNIKLVDLLCDRAEVIWWVHENSERTCRAYSNSICQVNSDRLNEIVACSKILAVSEIAKKNFEKNTSWKKIGVMPFGIPDRTIAEKSGNKNSTVIAVIGNIDARKAQDIFLQAAAGMPQKDAEFWLIGRNEGNAYGKRILEMAEEDSRVILKGELSREEIVAAFEEIDILVCSSLEETMSITVVEGMMNGKACITTDNTGIAEYICPMENGLVAKAGDVDSLRECMTYFVEHPMEQLRMGKVARATYEAYFTIDAFTERMRLVMEE